MNTRQYRYYFYTNDIPTNEAVTKQFNITEEQMKWGAQCVFRRQNCKSDIKSLNIYEIDEATFNHLKQENTVWQYTLFIQEGRGQIRTLPKFPKKKSWAKVTTADKLLAGV